MNDRNITLTPSTATPSEAIKQFCRPSRCWPFALNLDNQYTKNLLTAADEHHQYCGAVGKGAEAKGSLRVRRGFDPYNGAWVTVFCEGCGWWLSTTETQHIYPPNESWATQVTIPMSMRGGVRRRAIHDEQEENQEEEPPRAGAGAGEEGPTR